ncbi:uncharacterized protein BDW47DRAFT_108968 [Aspergillus candidus]|uniref:Uncharacterized protein n=1 Tax=Aspergillus candidus TaxID=41067 RepID=A0A2I2F6K4_ASPCN|nr:hypothetical protein BDW47DRAFT_108968 [Aspergillus candidus]PLB36216.1 hypothetical protein BDW47DRAFT_108968 [Aspergillus candidus]
MTDLMRFLVSNPPLSGHIWSSACPRLYMNFIALIAPRRSASTKAMSPAENCKRKLRIARGLHTGRAVHSFSIPKHLDRYKASPSIRRS